MQELAYARMCDVPLHGECEERRLMGKATPTRHQQQALPTFLAGGQDNMDFPMFLCHTTLTYKKVVLFPSLLVLGKCQEQLGNNWMKNHSHSVTTGPPANARCLRANKLTWMFLLSIFFPAPHRSHNQVGSAALTNNNWVLMGKAGTPTHFQQADPLARTPCLRAACHWLGAAYHCCLTSKAPFYL